MEEGKILYKDLSYRIIGVAMEVHRELGCGFLESVYDEAFAIECRKQGMRFEYQKDIRILYKGDELDKRFRCDFLVEDLVFVDNKATRGLIAIDEAQMHNYLKATGIRLGILVNYGLPSLESRRIVR